MRELCVLRHLSINTGKSYIHWLGRFGNFLKDPRFMAGTTEQKMEAFLTRLANEGVSATTQNQAFNALLFFYRGCSQAGIEPQGELFVVNVAFGRREGIIENAESRRNIHPASLSNELP